MFFVIFFFFKQKTAYEMRISDWSSDVCSSDLHDRAWIKISGVDRISSSGKRPYDDGQPFMKALVQAMADRLLWGSDWPHPNVRGDMPDDGELEIGRASCRERVCQYV